MNMFQSRSVLAALLVFAFHAAAHAEESIHGCWGNIQDVPASRSSTGRVSVGEVLCFYKNGEVATLHMGGFEGLESRGRFAYRPGRLVLTTKVRNMAWPFAVKADRCKASISSDQLTIGACKDFKRGQALILRRQEKPPFMIGIRGGEFD